MSISGLGISDDTFDANLDDNAGCKGKEKARVRFLTASIAFIVVQIYFSLSRSGFAFERYSVAVCLFPVPPG